MRALVTGAAGFIGSRLLAALRDGGHVATGLDIQPADIVTDVRDGAAVQRAMRESAPEIVFHLAGATLDSTRNDVYQALGGQINGTLAVLDAARQMPQPPRVVLASSFYVYAAQPASSVIDETTALVSAVLSPFPASKLFSEYLVKTLAPAGGIPFVIVRIGSTYGPGCSNAIGDFFASGLAGQGIAVWGAGLRRNQYVFVDDVANGLILAGQSAAKEIINLVPEDTATVADVAMIMAREFGFSVTFDDSKPEGASMAHILCLRAAELGWRPRGLLDGLRATYSAILAGNEA